MAWWLPVMRYILVMVGEERAAGRRGEEGLCYVRDDNDILTPLQFHDDGFEPDDHVTVGLASSVAVVVLVVVAGLEVFGVFLGDFLVLQ